MLRYNKLFNINRRKKKGYCIFFINELKIIKVFKDEDKEEGPIRILLATMICFNY